MPLASESVRWIPVATQNELIRKPTSDLHRVGLRSSESCLRLLLKSSVLPGVVDRLRSHAIPIIEEPTPSARGVRAIVHDPDGRTVEFYSLESST